MPIHPFNTKLLRQVDNKKLNKEIAKVQGQNNQATFLQVLVRACKILY